MSRCRTRTNALQVKVATFGQRRDRELLLTLNFRHSRVGGNPISLRYHDLMKTWIPAYAGMTGYQKFPIV